MAHKMLIDATQPEETRVAVVSEDDNTLQDFEFESSIIKQIKSNIYLAKVTRVEPSLQAAFLEYGGNRQGFLPFSEVHPDYFKIPIADRQKLLEQESASLDEDLEDDVIDVEAEDVEADVSNDEVEDAEGNDADEPTVAEIKAAKSEDPEDGVDDELEGSKPRFRISHRNYKIQEVVKPRQIMLVQVTKEERGNKGAAVTTFISLPGRYCVLMPNSNHGGGVSRKVSNGADRKKMKEILASLDIPEGMSVILRTAGVGRTKAEIKRDLNYLLRLWDKIRELTMNSTAPELVYEEGDLIKRSIRDHYGRDIDEVFVAGNKSYKQAKDFMKMLMPSHASRVKEYKDDKVPLFQSRGVEKQIGEIFSPTAYLPSGGYIVFDPTEALVSIDVNSGSATKERHIEETALKTNLEAADEVARQLRLRDLGGLVVVDFIDMEIHRNNRLVEKRLREALGKDRARVQVGKMSSFGLLELSRQRLRPSLFETNYTSCPHCLGTGRVRTVESAALHILRSIEREAIKRDSGAMYLVKVHPDVALYMLNQKRDILNDIQTKHAITIYVNAENSYASGQFELTFNGVVIHEADHEQVVAAPSPENKNHPSRNRNNSNNQDGDDEGGNKKKRRRGKRGGRRRQKNEQDGENSSENKSSQEGGSTQDKASSKPGRATEGENSSQGHNSEEGGENTNKKRRRGNRRRNNKNKSQNQGDNSSTSSDTVENKPQDMSDKPSKRSEAEPKKSVKDQSSAVEGKSKPSSAKKKAQKTADQTPNDNNAPQEKDASKPKKKGWWQRLKESD